MITGITIGGELRIELGAKGVGISSTDPDEEFYLLLPVSCLKSIGKAVDILRQSHLDQKIEQMGVDK
jgi:hypothetical protein